MNDQQIPPPFLPPNIPLAAPADRPLGSDPAEQAPLTGFVAAMEAMLRQPRRVMYQLRQPGAGRLAASLVVLALACALIYGLVVGSFSGGDQLWAAPAKIAMGLLLSALICLPSLYIFVCLSGAEARLAEVAGLVTGQLALTTVLLIGFAPVAWVFSQSTQSVTAMGALHLAFGLIAAYFGLRFLDAAFVHFHARSSSTLRIWILIFLMVMLQMTTTLRPIVGTADTLLPTQKMFFLSYWTECLK